MDYQKWADDVFKNVGYQLPSAQVRVLADAARVLVETEMRGLGVHLSHCNFGDYPGLCKYGDADCPALAGWAWFGKALERRP